MYTCAGQAIGDSSLSMNFMIWWDDDLLRETLDHAGSTGAWYGKIGKWDYVNGQEDTLLGATGTLSNNWTKGNPVLSGDILGDWREEALWRASDNRSVLIYTTTIPTGHRLPCQNPQSFEHRRKTPAPGWTHQDPDRRQ